MAKADLIPFKKGKDSRRNTTGKNKGSFSLLRLLKNKIQECPKGQDKMTYADLMVKKMLKESIEKGDIQHIKTIWAYIEGMPKQNIDVMSGGEKIIPIYNGKSIQKHNSNKKGIRSDKKD